MPRIRSIKPEFFTDSRTGMLSPLAKTLFVGLWCHADDCGVVPFDLMEFKAKILPYEREDEVVAVLRPLVDELLPKGLVVYFVLIDDPQRARRGLDEGSRNTPYLWIPTFVKHQRIDRPSQPLIPGWMPDSDPFSWPGADLQALSELDSHANTNVPRRGLAEHSTRARAGEERRGEELGVESRGVLTDPANSAEFATAQGSKPEEVVFQAWRGSMSSSRAYLTDKRRKTIRARLREGYSVEDLVDAVRGWVKDPWPERVHHNDLGQLLRDGAHVEKFRDLHRAGPATATGPARNGRSGSRHEIPEEDSAAMQAWMDQAPGGST